MEKFNPENKIESPIESQIENLLERLDSLSYDQMPAGIQDEWYEVEMEAQVGQDRETAAEHLNQFVEKISQIPKKSEN
ncbi:MAG: hypothetical protein Q8O49_00380 [bacterium]|nr:hypothetical protein [bacterium]